MSLDLEFLKNLENAGVPRPIADLQIQMIRTYTDNRATREDLWQLELRLKGEIGVLKGSIGELRGEVGTIRGEIGEIRGQIGELRGEIGELRGQISDIKTLIIQSHISFLERHWKWIGGLIAIGAALFHWLSR